MSINLNSLAVKISKKEGLKKNLSIAQIKEVLRITLRELKEANMKDVMQLLSRIK